MFLALYLLAFCVTMLVTMPFGPVASIAQVSVFVTAFIWLEFRMDKSGRSMCPAPILRWLKRGPFLATAPLFIVTGMVVMMAMTLGLVIAYEEVIGHPYPECTVTLLEGLARFFCA